MIRRATDTLIDWGSRLCKGKGVTTAGWAEVKTMNTAESENVRATTEELLIELEHGANGFREQSKNRRDTPGRIETHSRRGFLALPIGFVLVGMSSGA
jgi:hypothetical protein